jgi:hypothetical protein
MMQLLTFSPPARAMFRTVVFALCGFLCTAHALADTFQIDGNTYKTTSDNTCSLTKGCDSTAVTIPQEVSFSGQTYTVTEIGEKAFYYGSNLTSIELPNTIKSIGNYAFYRCSSLQNIVIPDSVTTIGDFAFYWCNSLTTVNLPDALTDIGRYAFYWCYRMASLEIPQSVTTLGDFAFYYC